MRKKILKYIVCPKCGSGFKLEIFKQDKNHVMSGSLKCKCNTYPIILGVPRILSDDLMIELVIPQHSGFFEKYSGKFKLYSSGKIKSKKAATAKGFGYEWKKFPKIYREYEEQFLDWILPVKKEFFKGKLILDAGCGTGRHMYFASKYAESKGKGFVIGIDLGEATEVAFENVKELSNAEVIQADIYSLPFRDETFDYAYSIGVLHHLPKPGEGFSSIIKKIKRTGAISAWVYGKENNTLLKIMNPIRKYFLCKMPLWFLKALSFSIIIFVYPVTRVYKGLKNIKLTKKLVDVLPQSSFFLYLADLNFNVVHSILFDQFLAPVAFYHTKDEFKQWFEKSSLRNIKISWRNKNSWRGYGEK